MARIAYVSIGMASTIHGSLELARRLERAGHAVTFLSHRDIEAEVRTGGHHFVPLNRAAAIADRISAIPTPFQNGRLPSVVAWRQWLNTRKKLRFESLANDEIETEIGRLETDLVLLDIETHFAIIATHRLNVPRLLVNFFLDVHLHPRVPPLDSPLPFPRSATGRVAASIANLRTRWDANWTRLRQGLPPAGLLRALRVVTYDTASYDDLSAVAKHRAFPMREQTSTRQWLRPFLYTRLPILCLNLAELDFPHEPPANVTYVGPMLNRARQELRVSAENRQRIRDLIAQRERQDTVRPLVYCTISTFFAANQTLIKRLLDVFRQRRDWDIVLGLGGKMSGKDVLGLPGNILVMDWAPQAEILSAAECAIVHGGVSGINECLAAGVPMVLYGGGRLDQPGMVARVVHHGLGVAGNPGTDDAQTIERRIEQAMTDSRIRDQLRIFRDLVERYESENRAIAAVESHVKTNPH